MMKCAFKMGKILLKLRNKNNLKFMCRAFKTERQRQSNQIKRLKYII